jgi:RAMP superfamily
MNATSRTRLLRVDLLDTWHVGTGRGAGAYLDAVVDLDADGLPWIPGRTLRGLLRDAAECLQAWGHVDRLAAAKVEDLFGGLVAQTAAPSAGRTRSVEGRLAVSSARLPQGLRTVLLEGEPAVRDALRVPSFQTAIDTRTGCALAQSLRGIELAVPMTLEGAVEVWGTAPEEVDAAWRLLDAALPLVQAVGAYKSRGHGRARLRFVGAGGPGGTA